VGKAVIQDQAEAAAQDAAPVAVSPLSALGTTERQMDGILSQLPYKCHLEEVAFVGD